MFDSSLVIDQPVKIKQEKKNPYFVVHADY